MFLPAVLCSLVSCGSAADEVPATPPEEVRSTTGPCTELKIWPTVDTVDVASAADIACLRAFFCNKLDAATHHTYWSQVELERYGQIQPELLYAEFDEEGDLAYVPTLMERRVMPDGSRLLRVKWAQGEGMAEEVKQVFAFWVKDGDTGPRLEMPLELNTRAWPVHQVEDINYVVSPSRTFDPALAQRQWEEVQALGAFFVIAPFPFTYYSYLDPAELFRARGFELHPRSYTFPTGGRLDHATQVSAGNNSERYTHEVVHAFIHRALGPSGPNLLHEGLATYLGGCNERSYLEHRRTLKDHLDQGGDLDLDLAVDPYRSVTIGADTNLPYTVGAVIVEHVLRTFGKERLFSLFATADVWGALAQVDIHQAELKGLLQAELAKPPLEPVIPLSTAASPQR